VSESRGLGHCRLAAVSESVAPRCPPQFSESSLRAVGQWVATSFSGREFFAIVSALARPSRKSRAATVGQHEHALPLVRCADLGRAEAAPLRIEPHLGQLSENLGKSESNMPRHVFHDDEAGSHLANDPGDVGPEVSGIVCPSPPSGNGERLAWIACRDEIHDATPRAAVECCEVIPDRSRVQGAFLHSRHKDAGGVSVPLAPAHGAEIGPDAPQSEFKSANTGT